MIEGEGSYAMTGGERNAQRRGDLVLGPSWGWHSHGNLGDDPAVWFDALDIPLVKIARRQLLRGLWRGDFSRQPAGRGLAEFLWQGRGDADVEPGRDRGDPASQIRLGRRPRGARRAARRERQPVRRHDPRIRQPAERRPDHADAHLSPAKAETRLPDLGPPPHTSSAVYVAAEGAGTITAGDKTFDWTPGDVISLPSWCWHAHANRSKTEDAILFSVSDAPTLKALGLYREERET